MNKEKLKKIASGLLEAVGLLKTADTKKQGIAKLEEIEKEIDAEEATPTPTPADWEWEPAPASAEDKEEMTKTVDSIKSTMGEVKEEIKKWAYISVDAQTVKDLLDQFNELKWAIAKKEDVEKITERLETLEKTPVVKQESIEKTAQSPFAWMLGSDAE